MLLFGTLYCNKTFQNILRNEDRQSLCRTRSILVCIFLWVLGTSVKDTLIERHHRPAENSTKLAGSRNWLEQSWRTTLRKTWFELKLIRNAKMTNIKLQMELAPQDVIEFANKYVNMYKHIYIYIYIHT